MVSAGRRDALLIESLQAEGGKVLKTRDFLAGQRWTAGKRFD
jgi:methionyl-tRNA formyltransferase